MHGPAGLDEGPPLAHCGKTVSRSLKDPNVAPGHIVTAGLGKHRPPVPRTATHQAAIGGLAVITAA